VMVMVMANLFTYERNIMDWPEKENEYYQKFTEGLDCNFYTYKGSTKEQQHKEMLERRHNTIGASDVGKIMNLSDYGCATLVYREKKGMLPPKEESWPLLRGSALEPVVLSILRKKHPHLEILEGNKIVCVHKEYDFLQCNVDAMIINPDGTKTGCEIKNISPYNKDKWQDGAVPDDYYAQCQFSMYITGLNRWRLAVSFDCEPLEYFIDKDDDFILDMQGQILNFKMMLDNNQQPLLDTNYYNEETFMALYPAGTKHKNTVIASKEIGQILIKLNELNKTKKEIEDKIKYYKPFAEFYMGEKNGTLLYEEEIETDGVVKKITVTARMQESISKPKFSLDLFKQKFPEVFSKIEAECIEQGKSSRSFGWYKVTGLE
jgi:putative phage-type endonuclease